MIKLGLFLKICRRKFCLSIPANSHSLGVSLTILEIKYDLTPDFSNKAKSHYFSIVSLLIVYVVSNSKEKQGVKT